MGLVTVSGQIILPLAGDLAKAEDRGRIVGIVSSGITTGITVFQDLQAVLLQDYGVGGQYMLLQQSLTWQ